MSAFGIGEAYALLAAVVWAVALVLFKFSGERVSPLALNLFKSVVGIALLALTLVAAQIGVPFLAEEKFGNVLSRPASDFVWLALSGVVGIALADTLFFYALNAVGVGIISIVDCLYTPFVFICAWILFREEPTFPQYVGGALVLGGILVASRHAPPPNRSAGQILIGITVGATAMACMAVGIVGVQRILHEFPLIWAASIRLVAGAAALAILALFMPTRHSMWTVFKPSASWRTAIPGAVLGTYFAYVLWVAGFKYANAGIAAVLNQTTTIFSIILATVVVKEALTRRKTLAVTLAMIGVITVVLHKQISEWLGAGVAS